MSDLVCELDTPLPPRVARTRGPAVFLRGRLYHRAEEIRDLAVVVGARSYAVETHSRACPEAVEGTTPLDSGGFLLTSTFWAAVPVAATATISLSATLASGSTAIVALGDVEVVDSDRAPDEASRADVAICLVTRDTPRDLLAAKIASILAQDLADWSCIVVDDGSSPVSAAVVREVASDSRFRIVRNDRALGTYRALQQALEAVPRAATYVVLAEPDDVWDATKLSRSVAAFDPGTTLVHNDVRGARPARDVTDLGATLIANPVAASSMTFRTTLLELLLPFPPDTGLGDAASWIASAAAATGRIRGLDEELQAIGPRSSRMLSYFGPAPDVDARSSVESLALAPVSARARTAMISDARDAASVVPVRAAGVAVLAATLLARMTNIGAERRRILDRLARADRSVRALLTETVRLKGARQRTRGRDVLLLRSLVLLRVLTTRYKRTRTEVVAKHAEVAPPYERDYVERRFARIVRDTTPLNLRVSATAEPRINFVTHMIDFRYVYGAYIMVFHVALALAAQGRRVRMLVANEGSNEPFRWEYELRSYPGLETLLDRIEIVQAHDRSQPVDVSADDSFVAITSWTAHIAHSAARAVGRERFLYLILEYDPLVFPVGSEQALSAAAYDLPHDAIFSTELLRRYFREHRLGVYRDSEGDARSVAIDNPIAQHAVTPRESKRLLLYARPEDHAQRNCFELAVLALREVASSHPEWSYEGVGALQPFDLPLHGPTTLHVHPRVGLDAYLDMMSAYDVGVALQATPHSGLVSLDMAAAGLVSVTNTFDTKTRDDLTAISGNILPVDLTVADVRRGIVEAMARSRDVEARRAGADLRWPRSWDEAITGETLARILGFESFRSIQ